MKSYCVKCNKIVKYKLIGRGYKCNQCGFLLKHEDLKYESNNLERY